jgi:hypothetical protein
LLELIQKHCTLKSYNVVAKWHIRIYDCIEKEEYENQKVKRKTNRSRPTKQNKIKARYKTKPKKNWTKTQASTTNPKHKTRVSIQSEEPLTEDSEEQAVHIIPH